MGIDRLRRSGRFPIKALAVISEESMILLCKKYDIGWTFYKNDPLGEKKNHGLVEAMKLEWDYLIELGSDDLLFNGILDLYAPYFGVQDMFGMKATYYINSETGDCRELKTDTSFGMGRAIRRQVIEKCCWGIKVEALKTFMCPGRSAKKGETTFVTPKQAEQMEVQGFAKILGEPTYKLWHDGKTRGMDNNSEYFLMMQGIGHYGITSEPMGVDIKGKENIWPYNPEVGIKANLEEILKNVSEEEAIALIALIKKNKQESIETAVIR